MVSLIIIKGLEVQHDIALSVPIGKYRSISSNEVGFYGELYEVLRLYFGILEG
jgi:hypothetical protein